MVILWQDPTAWQEGFQAALDGVPSEVPMPRWRQARPILDPRFH